MDLRAAPSRLRLERRRQRRPLHPEPPRQERVPRAGLVLGLEPAVEAGRLAGAAGCSQDRGRTR